MIGKPTDLNNLHLAVLIDADNIPHSSIRGVMEEIAIYGTPTIKRIYGDWTSPNVGGWKGALLEHAITPVQQYGYTTGKNSTDSAMIIDAMDILYSGKTDGFVLISSDSDFTRLAIRLREAGQKVIGIGERKTPNPFIVACDKFIYIEVIRDHQRSQGKSPGTVPPKIQDMTPAAPKEEKGTEQKEGKAAPAPIQLIADSIADIADHDGYAFLGELGNLLLKKQPDFDARNYGFLKLTPLIKSIPRFEINVRETKDANIKHIYVRDREA
ncbi:MAG: NYN domain-containing protein [Oscillospiraceae bacterium]|nr:NYN domain-containing protein [Oscillospiraceae bacterium]